MVRALITRRALAGAAAASCLAAERARGLGRTPIAGKLALALPWPTGSVDPHDARDPAAALFGHALFDPLFGVDAAGEPYPSLATDVPIPSGARCVVRLREGLVTAKGKRLDARDVVFSLQRARRGAALAFWGDLPPPTTLPKEPLAVAFATSDAKTLARTLSSPFFALVPRGFEPTRPDGTGAMAAEMASGRLALKRNVNAARGASYLEEASVDQAPDLSSPLRLFEGNLADVGWLGSGLHAPRPGAVAFDFGSVGFITLQTGNEAGSWNAPGISQRLLDGLPPERLQRFALGPLPPAAGGAEWGGKPSELVVAEGSAYLEELARTLSSLWSRPGHEITVKTLPPDELARRRSTNSFALALGVVRPFAGPGLATLVALAAAVDPAAALELMRRPPRLTSFAPRVLTRTLRVGVLGDLRVMGAHAPDVHLARGANGDGWDLGASYRATGP